MSDRVERVLERRVWVATAANSPDLRESGPTETEALIRLRGVLVRLIAAEGEGTAALDWARDTICILWSLRWTG